MIKLAAAIFAVAAALYFAQVGREDLTIPSKPSATAAAPEVAPPTSDPSAVPNDFLASLVEGAKVDMPNVELIASLDMPPRHAGIHLVAKKDIAAGETVIILPATLQFNDQTVDMHLRKGLQFIAEHDAALGGSLKAPASRDFAVTMSLMLEMRKGNGSKWWPWLATFPSAKRSLDTLGYFASNEEFACLPPRGQRILSAWRQRATHFQDLAKSICATTVVGPAKVPAEGQPKMTSQTLVQKFMCLIDRPMLDWAVSTVTARAFHFVRYTTLFPLLDVLPYRINASLRPGPVRTEDNGRMVSIEVVATADIPKGEPFSFRTDLRDPLHAMLQQGFHDPNTFLEGYEVFMDWSPLVRNVTGQERHGPRPEGQAAYPLAELNCGASHEANLVGLDGTYDEELLRCAELQVLASRDGADATDPTPLQAYTFDDPTIRSLAIELVLSAAAKTTGDTFTECTEVLLQQAGGHSVGHAIGEHLVYLKGIMDRFIAKLKADSTKA